MKEHITIIGAGNLTVSILEALKRSRAKFTINVVDIDKKKSSRLKRFGIKLNTTYDDKISKSKLILLIVKPKDYVHALKSIHRYDLQNYLLVKCSRSMKSHYLTLY